MAYFLNQLKQTESDTLDFLIRFGFSSSTFPSTVRRCRMLTGDANPTPGTTKKVQLLTLIRNTKPYDFDRKSDGWTSVLVKSQNKGIYSINKTWLDFYYEIWISHLDDTIVSNLRLFGDGDNRF